MHVVQICHSDIIGQHLRRENPLMCTTEMKSIRNGLKHNNSAISNDSPYGVEEEGAGWGGRLATSDN